MREPESMRGPRPDYGHANGQVVSRIGKERLSDRKSWCHRASFVRTVPMKKLLPAFFLAVATATVSAQTTGTFTGGDPGEGLDLNGTFAYALDIGGDGVSRVVNGVTFTDDDSTPGVTAIADNLNFSYQTPNYDGATTLEDNLENITRTIIWDLDGGGSFGDVSVTLAVTPGQQYQLQLIFQDDTANRGFDIFMEGGLLVDNFKSGTGNLTSGTVVTHTFTAADNSLLIQLDGTGGAFDDKNAILSAVTLENVPEPTSMVLAMLGSAGLLGLRRQRR
jgi:hypothetical protein